MSKVTRVTPVHKDNIKANQGNCRPISILPTLSRVLEKCFST